MYNFVIIITSRESPADQALSRVPPDREILQWIVPMAAFQSREWLHTDTCQLARVLIVSDYIMIAKSSPTH